MVTGCLPWKLNTQTNRIENIEDLLDGRFDIPAGLSTGNYNILYYYLFLCFFVSYHMNLDCATLLCKMLVPHPAQRARLNEVRKHPWINKGYMDYPPRFLEVTNKI